MAQSFSLRDLFDDSIKPDKMKENFQTAKEKYDSFENLGRKLTREELEERNKAYNDMKWHSQLLFNTYGIKL